MFKLRLGIMKKLWATVIFISLCFISNAQFSVSAKYGINSFPEWEEIFLDGGLDQDDFIGDGFEYGFSYWFRLKNYRVEFLPEVSYQNLSHTLSNNTATQFEKESFFFTFNTQFYTLDIEGDCNCPTWGKDGSFIEKGFFVGVSPGIGYHNLSSQLMGPSIETAPVEVKKWAFRLGVSAGLDIGILEWLTLTPYATLNYTPALTWDGLENIAIGTQPGDQATKIWQVQPGLRLAFRPDYIKEQRSMFR